MTFEKVTVVGLGLIGGSLASALKKSAEVSEVFGVEKDGESLQFAMENGIVDDGASRIGPEISDSQVVVIATYVDAISQLALEVSKFVSTSVAVCDTGSVKAPLVREMEKYRESVSFVGAHPIAGTEKSGVRAGRFDLFSGKKCVLTPVKSTDPEAFLKVKTLFELAGSRVIETNPETHDEIFSLVSHLPHAVAYSLLSTVACERKENLLDFSGGGLADFTRICESSPKMWAEILIQNRDPVLKAIRNFAGNLEKVEKAVSSGDSRLLESVLSEARDFKLSMRKGGADAGKNKKDG